MSRKHWLALALTAVIALVPTAAFSHAELDTSTPGAGSTVASVPSQTTLSFTEEPAASSVIQVFDGCHKDVNSGQNVSGKTITVTLAESAQPGDWKVTWKSISADDAHAERGSYSFAVSGKADCSKDKGGSGAAASGDGNSGSSFPIIWIIVAVIVLLGLALLVRSRAARA
ncbi:MAG: copper resistance protein CopC [Actinomycetota bacterium]|nr:copper resistance protein CopC [Actinomycetota bacterium]